MQSGLAVLPSFLDQMGRYFKVSLRRVDFLRQKEIARLEMNTYVKEKTFGKIKDLIQSSDITPFTKMVLVSTLYMKVKWKKPFLSSSILLRPFFISSDKTASLPFMTDTAFYPYFKSENFTALSIPYVHPKENMPELEFLILLPSKNFGISELEKQLDNELFKNVISHLESEEISLFLPKFTFSKSMSLKDTLIAMGMKDAFNAEADFSGIVENKELQLGQVSHKVFIEVDENGTEAAAATSVTMNTKAFLREKEPIVFDADHPFIFLIYEKLT
ncbi:MAG TPA: serpin family protein, partial [Parachlamydiaceae bacterium]|nr:serpin family protein [Parachlamydiaceae bacterium]